LLWLNKRRGGARIRARMMGEAWTSTRRGWVWRNWYCHWYLRGSNRGLSVAIGIIQVCFVSSSYFKRQVFTGRGKATVA
jgi:hypothetical protein